MAIALFWTCCALLVYVYAAYPVLVRLLAKRFGTEVRAGSGLPSVTIVVTAYNEQACIEAKLVNLTGLDYPADRLSILVVSDGSSDATEQIAARFNPARVRVLRVEGRRGKTACQNAAAKVATTEVIIFTDATTRLRTDAVRALVAPLSDPTVGCVGGRLEYVTDVENVVGSGGEAYWSYEMRLRAGESRLGSLIGVSGCLYAVRRLAYRDIDPALISDFVIAMRMREQNLRTVLAPNALCFEATLDNSGQELSMRVRVAIRSLNALVREHRFLNPFRYGRFAWQLWSHKLLRYASPLLWLGALAANIVLARDTFYLVLLGAQCALIASGLPGFLMQSRRQDLGLLGRPYYLLLTNAASLIAMLRYVRGDRMVIWKPIREQPTLPSAGS